MASEEKKEAAASSEATPGFAGGSKMVMIVTIVNLLLTLGIGATIFLKFQKDKHAESLADISADGQGGADGQMGADAGKGEGHGGAGGLLKKNEGPKLVSLEQFTVNLSTTAGTPPKFARVVIAVELGSEEAETELNQKMPQVRNAIIDLFNSKRPVDIQTGEGRNFLREEIRNALNSFLVTGKVKGVFFSNFAISN